MGRLLAGVLLRFMYYLINNIKDNGGYKWMNTQELQLKNTE